MPVLVYMIKNSTSPRLAGVPMCDGLSADAQRSGWTDSSPLFRASHPAEGAQFFGFRQPGKSHWSRDTIVSLAPQKPDMLTTLVSGTV